MKNVEYQINTQEIDFAATHLAKTRDAFVKSIEGLTDKQWYHRPGPGQWSIAECADHLLQTELYYFEPTIKTMLAEPANPERLAEATGKDAGAYSSMEDRSYKIKGAPWEEVFEKKIDRENLISSFLQKRNEMIEWVKNTDEELRVHFTVFPGLDTIDVYQFILFISGHTTRHTGQILDIVESEFYPN